MPWLLIAKPLVVTTPPSTGAVTTLYFSDAGFVTSPVETPANTYFDRRLDVALTVKRSLYSSGSIGGRSDASFGEITLANDDGALDALGDYFWDGREIEVRFTAVQRPTLADFTAVFAGLASAFLLGDMAIIRLADRQAQFDLPYGSSSFAGTGGAEGPSTLSGRRKPRAIGRVTQIEPVAIDAANLIWCYGDGPSGGVVEARDRGVALTPSAGDFSTYAALVAATMTTAAYATCNALSLIRLRAAPAGTFTITVDGRTASGVALLKFADVVKFLATIDAGLTSTDIDASNFAAFNAAEPASLSWWNDGSRDETVRSVIDALAQGIRAYWGFGTSQKLAVGQFTGPAGSAAYSLTDRDMFRVEQREVARMSRRQVIRYDRRWRVLNDNDLAGGAAADRVTLGEEWQQAISDSADAAILSPLAATETVESYATGSTRNATEAAARISLFGTARRAYEIEAPLITGIDVGVTVNVSSARFGLSTGRNLVVMEFTQDAAADVMTLTVWG